MIRWVHQIARLEKEMQTTASRMELNESAALREGSPAHGELKAGSATAAAPGDFKW
jgi:hypothetical protein